VVADLESEYGEADGFELEAESKIEAECSSVGLLGVDEHGGATTTLRPQERILHERSAETPTNVLRMHGEALEISR
jgi:hypothetical protein